MTTNGQPGKTAKRTNNATHRKRQRNPHGEARNRREGVAAQLDSQWRSGPNKYDQHIGQPYKHDRAPEYLPRQLSVVFNEKGRRGWVCGL